MGFRTGAFATCWEVEPGKGKFSKVRLSINRKNKETGEWELEFNGYCMFIGNANAKAQQLKRQSRIKLGDVDVTNTYDKETKKEYITYKVFSFDMADETQAPHSESAVEGNNTDGDTGETGGELPW